MYGEITRNEQASAQPVDLSEFMRGCGLYTLDRDRDFSAAVPVAVYRRETAEAQSDFSPSMTKVTTDPDHYSHPLAAQSAFRLILENGEL